jgi:hypothetical protein
MACGQGEPEGGAVVAGIADEVTAMGAGQSPGHGKSESCAAGVAVAGLLQSDQASEDAFALSFGVLAHFA